MCLEVQYNGAIQSGNLCSQFWAVVFDYSVNNFFSDFSLLSFQHSYYLGSLHLVFFIHVFNIFSPLSFSLISSFTFWEISSPSSFCPCIDFSFLFSCFLTSKGFVLWMFLFSFLFKHPVICVFFHDRYLLLVSSCSRVSLFLNFFFLFLLFYLKYFLRCLQLPACWLIKGGYSKKLIGSFKAMMGCSWRWCGFTIRWPVGGASLQALLVSGL